MLQLGPTGVCANQSLLRVPLSAGYGGVKPSPLLSFALTTIPQPGLIAKFVPSIKPKEWVRCKKAVGVGGLHPPQPFQVWREWRSAWTITTSLDAPL